MRKMENKNMLTKEQQAAIAEREVTRIISLFKSARPRFVDCTANWGALEAFLSKTQAVINVANLVAAYDSLKATGTNLDIDPATVAAPAPPVKPTYDADGFFISGVAAIDALKTPKDIRNFKDYAKFYRGPHSAALKRRVEEINAKFDNQGTWDWRRPAYGGKR
jgi:hypothetical protein